MHGALAESEHVFIRSGLEYYLDHHPEISEIKIFEVGFGTGLNALLSFNFSLKHDLTLSYVGIEKYLIGASTIDQLGVGSIMNSDTHAYEAFIELHKELKVSSPPIEAKVMHDNILEASLDLRDIDVVFFDAFGPRTQPALWETKMMEKMHQILKRGGVLTTFCAQGQFRRNLKSAGFEVEKIPGPPGKRDMTRAIKV